MKFEEIQIKGFKSVREASLKFNHSCLVLVGKNESGKSSVLEAANLLRDGKFEVRNIHYKNEIEGTPIEENYVKFLFQLHKEDINEIIEEDLTNKFSEEALKKLKFINDGKEIDLATYFLKYRSLGNITIDPLNNFSTKYYTTDVPQDTKLKSDNFIEISQVTAVAAGIKSATTSMAKTIVVLESQLPETIELSTEEKFDTESLNAILGTSIRDYIDNFAPNSIFWSYENTGFFSDAIKIDDFIKDPTSYTAFKNVFLLAGFDDPAKIAADKIKNGGLNVKHRTLKKLSNAVTKYLNDTWQEYDNIKVSIEYDAGQLIILVSDKDEDSNLYTPSQRSFGFKKFILFLLHVAAEIERADEQDLLLLIDEPEIGLHPSAVCYFRDKLLELAEKEGIYVIYSTHSEHAIDPSTVDRHYLVTKNAEETILNKAKESSYYEEQILLQALGSSEFRKIADINIVLEGWTDYFVLKKAINTTKKSTKISKIRNNFAKFGVAFVCGAKSIQNFAPMIQLARRQCVILTDSDVVSNEQKKIFENANMHGSWFTYGQLLSDMTFETLEDFLKEAYWKTVVKSKLKDSNIPTKGLDYNRPRCKNFKAFCAKKSIESNKSKVLLKAIKDECFTEDLKTTSLEDKYFDMLNAFVDVIIENNNSKPEEGESK